MGIRTLLSQIYANKFIRWAVLSLFIIALFLTGIQLRRWIGDTTRHVRYQHDIVNAFYWGSEVLKEARRLSPDERSAHSWAGFFHGYFALYDRVKDKAYEQEYGLDYAPLRLLAMAIWAKEVRDGFPWVDDDHPKLVNPLLKINLICELCPPWRSFFWFVSVCGDTANAVIIAQSFAPGTSQLDLRSRGGKRRMARTVDDSRCAWLATMGRLDPALLFVRSVRSLEKSMVLVRLLVGCRRNAQRTIIVRGAFFCFLPLWQKKWLPTLRVLAGFVVTMALIVSPWLLRTPAAWIAVATVAGISRQSSCDTNRHMEPRGWQELLDAPYS